MIALTHTEKDAITALGIKDEKAAKDALLRAAGVVGPGRYTLADYATLRSAIWAVQRALNASVPAGVRPGPVDVTHAFEALSAALRDALPEWAGSAALLTVEERAGLAALFGRFGAVVDAVTVEVAVAHSR